MAKQILVAIAGLGGAIGTTVATGFSCHALPHLVALGRITHCGPIADLHLDLTPINQVTLTGWDIKQDNLYDLATQQGICDAYLLAHAQATLKEMIPRRAFDVTSDSLGEWILNEAKNLREQAQKHKAFSIIVVNLCPTEVASSQVPDDDINWKDLKSIGCPGPGITPSRVYFRLAIEAGAHFVNFTPNHAETPSLKLLALERDLCFSGRDGKTGQTFFKTVIAPALRDRNLRVDGWFSTNILGNNDGQALAHPGALETKASSKSQCLPEILGYHPGGDAYHSCHQVHIHYYPPRGDAKEAWDNIDFTGFLGGRMQLKLNLLARDSILAAPLVMDLILLTSLAAGYGRRGHLEALNYFYKSLLADPAEHSASAQFLLLFDFLKLLKVTGDKS
jgi:myo-inositol-1-phosphate synthase